MVSTLHANNLNWHILLKLKYWPIFVWKGITVKILCVLLYLYYAYFCILNISYICISFYCVHIHVYPISLWFCFILYGLLNCMLQYSLLIILIIRVNSYFYLSYKREFKHTFSKFNDDSLNFELSRFTFSFFIQQNIVLVWLLINIKIAWSRGSKRSKRHKFKFGREDWLNFVKFYL